MSYLRSKSAPKKPTSVAAPSPKASLGRRAVCGRTEQRRPPVSKRYETKVRMVCRSILIAAAALKTPTISGYNAQGATSLFELALRFTRLSCVRPSLKGGNVCVRIGRVYVRERRVCTAPSSVGTWS